MSNIHPVNESIIGDKICYNQVIIICSEIVSFDMTKNLIEVKMRSMKYLENEINDENNQNNGITDQNEIYMALTHKNKI